MEKIVMASIAAVIGIIVLGSVLMPILDDATATTDTFTNDGFFYLEKYDESTNITLEWTYSAPTTMTVNDQDIELGNLGVGVTVLFTESFGLRTYWNNSGFQLMWATGTMAASVGSAQSMTIEMANGTAIVTRTGGGDTSSQTLAYDAPVYCIAPSGDYVMKKSSDPAYMLADSDFIGLGISSIGSINKVLLVKGTIEDGATITNISTTGVAVTFSDPVITSTVVDGFVGLSLLDKITFTGTPADATPPGNLTYSYFVVPHEVTAERAQHFTPGQNAIFAAIPVMIILAVLLGVVALVIRSRVN